MGRINPSLFFSDTIPLLDIEDLIELIVEGNVKSKPPYDVGNSKVFEWEYEKSYGVLDFARIVTTSECKLKYYEFEVMTLLGRFKLKIKPSQLDLTLNLHKIDT